SEVLLFFVFAKMDKMPVIRTSSTPKFHGNILLSYVNFSLSEEELDKLFRLKTLLNFHLSSSIADSMESFQDSGLKGLPLSFFCRYHACDIAFGDLLSCIQHSKGAIIDLRCVSCRELRKAPICCDYLHGIISMLVIIHGVHRAVNIYNVWVNVDAIDVYEQIESFVDGFLDVLEFSEVPFVNC
ncbi:hypothetical protein STEG23_017807, partial [Scotinomys teguina]